MDNEALARGLAHLTRCENAQPTFDLTSAGPLTPSEITFKIPSSFDRIFDSLNVESMMGTQDVKGNTSGNTQILESCRTSCLVRKIDRPLNNFAIGDDILTALEKAYFYLKLNNVDNKVMLLTPTFGYYTIQFDKLAIGYETFATTKQDSFLPNVEALEKAMQDSGIKTLLMCYPNNPTGAVMTQDCADKLVAMAKRNNFFIICDEAFISNAATSETEEQTTTLKQNFSIAASKGSEDYSVVIASNAKGIATFSKQALVLGPPDFANSLKRPGGPSLFLQRLFAASMNISDTEILRHLEMCHSYYLENIEIVKERCNKLNEKFVQHFGGTDQIPYVKPYIENPASTGVYLLDFSGLKGKKRSNDKEMNTCTDIAEWLLEESSVAVAPGVTYLFDEEEMLERIALNCTHEKLHGAFNNIELAIEKLQAPSKTTALTAERLSHVFTQLGTTNQQAASANHK